MTNFKRNRTAKLVRKARKKTEASLKRSSAKMPNVFTSGVKRNVSRTANAKLKAKHNLKSTGW